MRRATTTRQVRQEHAELWLHNVPEDAWLQPLKPMPLPRPWRRWVLQGLASVLGLGAIGAVFVAFMEAWR